MGDTNATIEAATSADASALIHVKPAYAEEQVADRFRWLQEEADGTWLILRLDGDVIGWCVAVWSGNKKHPEYPDIQDLFVKPEHRCRGHGTRLVAEVERLAMERGHNSVGIAVNPADNASAKRLYERLGYRHDGGAAYLDGVYDGHEDWVIDMEKQLT